MWARVQYDRWQDEVEQSKINALKSKIESDCDDEDRSFNKVGGRDGTGKRIYVHFDCF